MSIDGFLAQLLSLRTTESVTPEWLGGEAWVTLPQTCSDAPAPVHARFPCDPSADWIPL
ncbi:MAG: hypothetical protein KA357_07820 [Dokdonella sp.]|nr:hypothetical protein [Dokdonella sp.]